MLMGKYVSQASGGRQAEVKARPVLEILRPEFTAVMFYNRPDNGQAHSHALRLSRKEVSEDLVRLVLRQADSMIAHAHFHEPVIGAGRDQNSTIVHRCVLHRVEGVDDQIQQHLLQMNRIGVDRGKIGRQIRLHRGGAPEQVGMQEA